MANALSLDSVVLSQDAKELVILDQTLLPNEVKFLRLSKAEDIWEAIYSLRVRGAPAIGVAAAYGVYLLSAQEDTGDMEQFCERFKAHKAYLDTARPTAVNLSWALKRMEKVLEAEKGSLSVPQMKQRLLSEAHAIREEDIAISRSIGRLGFELLKPGDGILTHCNAGSLATAFYGTALGVVYAAAERGGVARVFADETRPVGQGARLTAWELARAGVPVTLICDDMAASLLASGAVDAVVVGADRVAANGDAANKIGTLGVAVLADRYGVPFYVAAPTSTVDLAVPDGAALPIEERDPAEVLPAPIPGVDVWNPAFDVTPAGLITAIITERGAFAPADIARACA